MNHLTYSLNDYLREVQQIRASEPEYSPFGISRYERRRHLVSRYAWAIPNAAALATIARYAPIVEVGSGTGYWAKLLREAGVDIVAYDLLPPVGLAHGTTYHDGWGLWGEPSSPWTEVLQGDERVAARHGDRALFLCWPPLEKPMAANCLRAYPGQTVLYLGEGRGGCTADDTFHDLLDRQWTLTETVSVPQWEGIHDHLTCWRRGSDVMSPREEPC